MATQEQLLDMLLYVRGIMLSMLFKVTCISRFCLPITCLSTGWVALHTPRTLCIFTAVSSTCHPPTLHRSTHHIALKIRKDMFAYNLLSRQCNLLYWLWTLSRLLLLLPIVHMDSVICVTLIAVHMCVYVCCCTHAYICMLHHLLGS